MRKSLVLGLIFLSIVANAQVSPSEKNIVNSIDKNELNSVQLLKEIVSINSGTMNFEGVNKVGDLLIKEFEKLGMEAKMISGESFGRAGHLVATTNGKKGPKFLLIGHLDTVFELESPFQTYTMLNDTTMNGPGVADMKGGDVIILLALKGLKDAGLLDNMQIEVIMTGDEEFSGTPTSLSKKALIEAAERADIALGFENADGDPKTIVTSRRGSLGWELKVTGNAAHSSQIFTEKVGVGAIYETSRILDTFYNQLSKEENLTFNPGVILGGTAVSYENEKKGGTAYGKSNVVAQEVIVSGDIRAVSLEQLEKAKSTMNAIVEHNYPGVSSTITFDEGGYPPLSATEGNKLLLKIYNQVSLNLGFGSVEAVNPRNAGAADISFTSGYVNMAIDGLGLSGDNDHTINEFGYINMMSVQAKRAAILMHRLSEQQVIK
jgi:glutamate carboxypeptidase